MTTNFPAHFARQYDSHLKHLKLKGLQPKTIDAYSRAIRRLGTSFDYRIDSLSEGQLTEYFSALLGTHSWSAVKLDLYGLKFFTLHVLKKPWAMPDLIKPPKTQRLPDIVTIDEAQRLFAATRVLSYRVFYFTLYSLGLRLGEGLALTVADIDAERMRVQVRDAKANRDRLVPLPQATLAVLRRFWQTHRHPELLFPNRHAGLAGAQRARSPLDRGGVQTTLRRVATECGLKKDHPAQPQAQLCHAPDRTGRRSTGSAEDPRPPLDSHHRPLHPSHQPHPRVGPLAHRCADAALHARLGGDPMSTLAQIIERFAPDYRARYGHTLTPERTQALSAMQHCRSRMAPQLLAACPDCAEQRLIPHSCGHRLCPHCQHHESERWLERQRRLQVPAEYFLLTTCRLHDIDPYTWLVDVLQRVGQHPAAKVAQLTPRLWKQHFADNPLRSDLERVAGK